MSGIMHICGSHGCESISIDSEAFEAANRARVAFAEAYREEHGAFPEIELQLQVVEDEYEAVALRRTMRVVA